jgi:hypothetical protein
MFSPGIKWSGREADHTRLVPRSRMTELFFYSSVFLHGVVLENYLYITRWNVSEGKVCDCPLPRETGSPWKNLS